MFLSEPKRVKENQCPYCNHLMDAISQIDGDSLPNPGDASICIKCINISIFDENLNLRKPFPEEDAAIKQSPDIIKMQHLIFEAHLASAKLRSLLN